MKRFLCLAILLFGMIGFGQCSFGTVSEATSNGANISTGGAFEYYAASDFDVPFGTLFTANQVKLNVLKGEADLEYVDIRFLEDAQGKPGNAFATFENIIPTNQEFAYDSEIEGMDAYVITVELPTEVELSAGKYYLDIQAAPGDETAVSWEITNQETTSVGRFDFSKFGDEDWFGGFSYYDYVFEISGNCTDTGEEQPDLGGECGQGNENNGHETAFDLRAGSLADDFIVEENTVFSLKSFKISTLQLGNIINATLQIRNSENDLPGDVIYSVENKGPKTENYFGYWPVDGFPLEVVSVVLEFEFEEAIQLQPGKYFIEVKNVNAFPFTDFLGWEGTSQPGIGGFAYFSSDDGESWETISDYNLVFDVDGFCDELMSTHDVHDSEFNYYPNPVQNELNISSKSEIQEISVYDLTGKLILNSKSTSNKVNVSHLLPGIYLVKTVLENGKTETFKIIKK